MKKEDFVVLLENLNLLYEKAKNGEFELAMFFFDLSENERLYTGQIVPGSSNPPVHAMLKFEIHPKFMSNLITPRVSKTQESTIDLIRVVIADVELTYSRQSFFPGYEAKLRDSKLKETAKLLNMSLSEYLATVSEEFKRDDWIHLINRLIVEVRSSPYTRVHLILKASRDEKERLKATSRFAARPGVDFVEYFHVEVNKKYIFPKDVENVWNSLSVTKSGALERLVLLKDSYIRKNYWAIAG